jgi:hypothetical protein
MCIVPDGNEVEPGGDYVAELDAQVVAAQVTREVDVLRR